MATVDIENPLIWPPPSLLTQVTDPSTGQQGYAFPLQTKAWLNMQMLVAYGLMFPLTPSTFTDTYGTFADEGAVDQAVDILNQINKTAQKYGDPKTLISSVESFGTADAPPETIYGHAVWLAAQTQITAQQIGSLLKEGLTEIGKEPDPKKRLAELTELLTGDGGINSWAAKLTGYIKSFQSEVEAFYDELNAELTGPKAAPSATPPPSAPSSPAKGQMYFSTADNTLYWWDGNAWQPTSLQSYLQQSGNVLSEARNEEAADVSQIEQLNKSITQLNSEYVGFTASASSSPALLLIPFAGVFLAVADATTFTVLAVKTKNQLATAQTSLDQLKAEDQKKLALVAVLGQFNTAVGDVESDGQTFLNAVSGLMGGWSEFQTQIQTGVNTLTPADVADWSKFMTTVNFNNALSSWNTVADKAEKFLQAGFVQFSTQTAS